jgi:cytochrome c5
LPASGVAEINKVVRNGRGLMPPVGKNWTDRQMDALIDYLQKDILRGG